MGLPIHAAPSDNSRKRKFTQENQNSRKRLREDDDVSANSLRPVVNGESLSSDAIVVLKPSRIAAILSKKKTSIRLKFSLPASIQRIWLCSQSAEPAIECVGYITSRTPEDAPAGGNKYCGDGSVNEAEVKSKYLYLIYGVSQLLPPLKYAQLRESGRIDELQADFQLLTQDLTAYLLSWPKNVIYADDTESGEIHSSARTKAIEKVVNHKRSSLNNYNNSPFQSQTISLYLPLSPIAQSYPLTGLCAEHISPLLLNYYKPLKGVALSYSNPRISTDIPLLPEDMKHQHSHSPQDNGKAEGKPLMAQVHSEYAVSAIWLTVDLVLLRPARHCLITGWINLVTESHIGLICWNLFSASIPAYYLPSDWEWVESKAKENYSPTRKHRAVIGQRTKKEADITEGYFLNSSGKKAEGWLTFRVENFDIISIEKYGEKGSISLQGSLLNEGEEIQRSSTKNFKTHMTRERRFVDLANSEENSANDA